MAKTVRYNVGPKRRIERKWARVNRALQAAATNAVLYNCDDSATVVRVVGDLTLLSTVATQANWEIILAIEPAGTPVSSIGIAEDLDNNEAGTTMVRISGSFFQQYDREVFHIDTKGMRKVKEGDQIVLMGICGVNDDIEVIGDLTIFLKE